MTEHTGTRTPAAAAALTATVGLAAVSWVGAVRLMYGMDMGVMTPLGSFRSFLALWVAMMAAMMLPGAAPAALRYAAAVRRVGAVVLFVGSYLAVWGAFGVAVFLLYRPHSALAAGLIAIAAGLYEFTPPKQAFRRRCLEQARSGLEFGLCCVGSSIGLMVMLAALGIMSLTWMTIIAALVIVQKFVPVRAAIDVPIALAVIEFGILIVIAPAAVPALAPPM